MKKTILAASLSAFTLIAAGSAFAQQGDARPDPKADFKRTELVARMEAAFAKLDTNGDGKVTAEERKALRDARIAERFKRLDADGNGAVTLEEMQASHDKRPDAARMKDGERKFRPAKAHGHGFGARGGMLGKMDANKDGVITKEEFMAPALARFDKMDTDRDGVLTAAERQAAREAMKVERPQRVRK